MDLLLSIQSIPAGALTSIALGLVAVPAVGKVLIDQNRRRSSNGLPGTYLNLLLNFISVLCFGSWYLLRSKESFSWLNGQVVEVHNSGSLFLFIHILLSLSLLFIHILLSLSVLWVCLFLPALQVSIVYTCYPLQSNQEMVLRNHGHSSWFLNTSFSHHHHPLPHPSLSNWEKVSLQLQNYTW